MVITFAVYYGHNNSHKQVFIVYVVTVQVSNYAYIVLNTIILCPRIYTEIGIHSRHTRSRLCSTPLNRIDCVAHL